MRGPTNALTVHLVGSTAMSTGRTPTCPRERRRSSDQITASTPVSGMRPMSTAASSNRRSPEVTSGSWSGDTVEHDGRVVSLPLPEGAGTGAGKALRLMCRPYRREIPIAVAAIGPKNVEMAARLANLWQPIHFLPEKFHEVWGESLRAGEIDRDPELGPLQILAGGTVALGSGPVVEGARRQVRDNIGFYVGAMGSRDKNFCNDLFKRYGYEREATEIQDLFLGGKRDEAMAAVPDDYVDRASLTGDEGGSANESSSTARSA
jgi:alkanesulfonate monooxygenase SsuD/methylene tetrahydromethanopterin reductase-like flavin-dependent oxidoreductase (luciferase family)